MVKEGCMDGLLYMPAICNTYKPRPFGRFRLFWPLPAAEAAGCERRERLLV